MNHLAIDIITNRWSPRTFGIAPVPDEVMHRLFDAARRAASSMNEQPWRFLYAHRGSDAHALLADTLVEGNAWAKDAPVLMITFVKTFYDRNNKENKTARHDLGLAMGNLSAQATHEGIAIHQMGGFSPEKAKVNFNIPDGYEAVTAVAIGYYEKNNMIPLTERKRRSVAEIAFENEFKV